MRTLRLDPDEVRVEGFETAAASGGAVRAQPVTRRNCTGPACEETRYTFCGTCAAEPTPNGGG